MTVQACLNCYKGAVLWHTGLRILTEAAFFALLAGIAVHDYRYKKIPDRCILFLGIVGVASILTVSEPGFFSRLAGIFSASLPLFLVTMLFPGAFGGGDIKLMAAAGLFLGGEQAARALLLGIVAGGIYAVVCLLTGRLGRKDRFAFGPFLCIGIVLAYILSHK